MAVDAVASVILQKLRDLLSEESFTNNKVIGSQLGEMQLALEEMRGFFIDAADKETSVEAIKKWTDDYLRHLYSVEDSIESFALRIARQKKRLGFLMNHALFLKKFTACKMLSRKLEKTQRKIQLLKDHTPAGLEDASLRPIRSLGSNGVDYSFDRWAGETPEEIGGEDDEEEGEGGGGDETEQNSDSLVDLKTEDLRLRLRHSVSTTSLSITEGSPRSLLWNSSFDPRSLRDASLIRERFQQSRLMYSYSYDGRVLYIVGYEAELRELLNRLTREDDLGDRVVSVVGEVGSGKTMLARAVYGNRLIKNRFKAGSCAFVTIFKECTTIDILLNLLKQVEKTKEQDDRQLEDWLKERIRQELRGKRYLIVLDGVESPDQWESLKGALPDEQNGSKIILTTCDDRVALLANQECQQTHFLKKLENEESWTLFLKKVGLEKVSKGSLKERIIQVCSGLPLNIVLLGSLLSTKKDNRGFFEEWTLILEKQENWTTSDILMLCYNDLDAHLKLCLLYMMLFPKELDIPVRRLQRLWLAEGFVKRPQNQDTFQEDVVQEYFDNLVKRSLILVSKLRSDGNPRKCRLLGVLHDFLSPKAQDIGLFHVHRGSVCHEDSPFGKRRLVEYADGKKCSLESSQHLRSYISFNFQKKDTPAKDVEILLNNMIGKGFGLLRVLDLEGVYKPSLPENLGHLFHLRYLGLRWTFLDKLPKSVGELIYLETLDLKHTYINRIPPSIWRLNHLRHLNLHEVHLDKDMPLCTCRSLPKLLTLWGLSIDHESPVKNGLSKLTQLRELGISFRLDNMAKGNNSTEDLVDWISKLTSLQSLRLRSKYDSGYPANLSLKPFSGLTQLSHMNLLGKLQNLPERDHFPPNIKVLTLSVSQLDHDPMPVLGQLRSLTVLRLLANSYVGEKIVCPHGTFRGLEVLKLWMLKELRIWEVEEGAMNKLKELNIRRCCKLENIPNRLLQQGTLKDLILTNMSEKFKEDVEKIDRKVSITVKDYKFTPLPGEEADDATNGTANGGEI